MKIPLVSLVLLVAFCASLAFSADSSVAPARKISREERSLLRALNDLAKPKGRAKALKTLARLAELSKRSRRDAKFAAGCRALAELAGIIRDGEPSARPRPRSGGRRPRLGIFDPGLDASTVPPSIAKTVEKLLATFDDYASVSDFSYAGADASGTADFANPVLAPFLENALAKAFGEKSTAADFRRATRMLSYAESHAKGLDRAESLAALGALLRRLGLSECDAGKLRAAERRYKEALSYGNKWFKSRKGSKISKSVRPPGFQWWTRLRFRIERALLDLSFDLLASEYGRNYADYVAMRSHFDKEEWWLAYPLADKLAAESPNSALGEAGRFYACRMLLINDTAEEYRDKSAPDGVAATKAFIAAKPYGLYRGQAMMELGKHFLEYKWDADEAAVWYERALKWFREVRGRDDAADLYALSDKLSVVAAVNGPETALDQWRMTKRRKIDPKEVVNRKTAPWLVSESERECLFHCGFLRYVKGDYEGAKKLFEQVKEIDPNIAKLVGLRWPNAYWRLISACNVKRMIFPPSDRKFLKGRNKLRCAYAELNYICERFLEAKKLFQEMLDDPKSSKNERAMAWVGLSCCAEFEWPELENNKEVELLDLDKAEKLTKDKNVLSTINYYRVMVLISTGDWGKGLKAASLCLKLRPKSSFTEEMRYFHVLLNIKLGRVAQARRLYRKYKPYVEYPDSGFTEELRREFEKLNKNKGGAR